MPNRIKELINKLNINREFIAHSDGDIFMNELPLSQHSAGYWMYKCQHNGSNSTNLKIDEMAELICLLLNREIDIKNKYKLGDK